MTHKLLVGESIVACSCGEFEAPNDPDRDAAWEEHVNETWYPPEEVAA